jgi:raffinose/stachyose/melibiose transport system permease protein
MIKIKKSDALVLMLLFLPGFAYYVFLLLYPLQQGLVLSFYRWPTLNTRVYAGIDNYISVFNNPFFWRSLGTTFRFMVLTTSFQVVIGYTLGYVLYLQLKGFRLFKTVFFLPVVLTTVSTAFIWRNIFSPAMGIARPLMEALGMGHLYISPLASTTYALGAVVMAQVWSQMGIQVILFNSGFMGINEEVLESAAIDGASGLRIHFSMIIPMSKPIFRTILILQMVGVLRIFDLIWVMTWGGPAHSTEILPLHLFINAFQHLRIGYGSVVGVVILVLALSITGLIRLLTRSDD